ncbi:MAG: hypothetical protein LAT68_04740 [Cyclobacteriaceae bacterium]|nr:hypothetical protein [Cyclobacteriaceae bacterium]MCH8515618.1 hypothetical protein [Cyclobacteriaceae bacterium]
MIISFTHDILIKYLNGELNSSDTAQFEHELLINKSLSKELKEFEDLIEEIKNIRLSPSKVVVNQIIDSALELNRQNH